MRCAARWSRPSSSAGASATTRSPGSCRSSHARGCPSTSIRAGSRSWRRCPRRRPARSTARRCATRRRAPWSPRMPREQTLFPRITDQALDDLRRRIGVKITDTLEPWCHEATRDNIRHYAHGIGDDNPLWCDPDYAAKTKFGGIIALPSFLFSTSRIVSGYVGGLPGVHAMWSGADWRWHRVVRRNDEIRSEVWLQDVIEHQTHFAGRAIQQIYHVEFFNQRGEKVAEADSWCHRTDRDLA